MNDLQSVVASLQSKIEKLIHLHQKQKDENNQLLSEKNNYLSSLELQNKRIKELEENNSELQNSARLSVGDSAKSKENNNKINEIVKEIDECIALLNK
jgi:predicted nuclease with TOPRIM domain